jgi:hydrogenase maturation factor HypF (carbamoyltransferase family)
MKQLKTEIIIETTEGVAFSWHSSSVVSWCPECGDYVEMALPGVAAISVEIGPREVFQRVRQGHVHTVKTLAGQTLICLASLMKETTKSTDKGLPSEQPLAASVTTSNSIQPISLPHPPEKRNTLEAYLASARAWQKRNQAFEQEDQHWTNKNFSIAVF